MRKQKSLDERFEPDAARYRKASTPHESPEAAEKSIREFYEAVQELRVKHQVANLYLIYTAYVMDDGTELEMGGHTGVGSPIRWLSMVAAAYGALQQEQDQTIRKLISGKK